MNKSPEELTQYIFANTFGERTIEVDIAVPFSVGEIESLKNLRDMSASWKQMVPPGSGLVRDLTSGLVAIPWAYGLKDKERARAIMRGTVDNIRRVREQYATNREYLLVRGDLAIIESTLLQFVPELIIPEE